MQLCSTLNTNAIALIHVAQELVPDMLRCNHGHFLVVASQTAFLATSGVAAYAASKSAAFALYEGLHTEIRNMNVSDRIAPLDAGRGNTTKMPQKVRRNRIRISCINPSAVQTPMFQGIDAPDNILLPRLMAEDVATRICRILWSGVACNELMPTFACTTPLARILPGWMKILAQDYVVGMASQLTPRHVQD